MNLVRRVLWHLQIGQHARWALLLAVGAFLLRLTSIWANVPDVPNPDEFKTIWPPLRMAYGNWRATGGYPPLYMYVLLVEYGAFFALGAVTGNFAGTLDFARQMIANPTPLYLMGRLTSVLLGTGTVLVLYAVGRRLYGGRVGLLAAAFLTFDTAHVYASQVVKNDVLMVALLVLSFWFACGILLQGRRRDYVFAGLLVGLATAAKYNALVGALPIVVAHLLQSKARGRSLPKALLDGPLWLAGLCTIAGFLLGYPHFLLDPGLAIEGLRTNSVGFFWDWLGWEGVPLGWMYYPLIALNTAWGLPLQLLAWAGFGAALARRRPVDLLLLVMPVANYLMMGGVRVNQPRYFFLGMPFLLVLAAKLAGDGWRWARPRLPVRLGRVAGPALLVALLAWPMGMSLFQDYMLLQPDPRVVARAWFEANVPHGSRVVLDLGGPRLTESAESLVVHEGPPQGRFAELQREIFAAHNPAYWIASIRHHINGEAYREGREASVQPLAWYQAQGYEYIVLSTLVYDSYRHWPGVAERYPRTMAFYGQVAREAELLAEFEPVITDPRDFTATDLNPIPTVRVYRSPSVD